MKQMEVLAFVVKFGGLLLATSGVVALYGIEAGQIVAGLLLFAEGYRLSELE